MKIFLIIPTLSSGGAERVISELANEWCREHQVTIVLHYDAAHYYTIDPRVEIKCLAEKPSNSRVQRIVQQFRNIFRLRAFVKHQKPDFCLSFLTKFNVVNLLSLSGINTKIIVSDRNNVELELDNKTKLFRKWTYSAASGIICQTEFQRNEALSSFPRMKSTCIPNPIRVVKQKVDFNEQKKILTIGRLAPQKGHERLLEIFARAEMADWTLTIVGAGELLDSLKAKAKDLGVLERVDFYGVTKDVDELFQTHDIFVLTSYFEGFPNALAEAMFAGMACVAFDCVSGPSELIESGKNGFLAEDGDIERFKNDLRTLMNDPQLRMEFAKNARQSMQKFTTEKVAQRYLEFCCE